jgi:IS5 family transposase
VVATAANVHDSTVLEDLLHGNEADVCGDSAYQGQGDTIKAHAPNARDRTNRRAQRKGLVNQAEQARNRRKSRVRARVEHVIGVIKLKFGFAKVRYRGLEKNANRLFAISGLANLYILRKRLPAA